MILMALAQDYNNKLQNVSWLDGLWNFFSMKNLMSLKNVSNREMAGHHYFNGTRLQTDLNRLSNYGNRVGTLALGV